MVHITAFSSAFGPGFTQPTETEYKSFHFPNTKAIREPNLLVPGTKPVGPVKVDWSHQLIKGCVGYWPLWDGSRARDMAGSNHSLSVGGSVVFTPEGAEFPGPNGGGYIDVGLQSWYSLEGTMSIWAKSKQTDDASVNVIIFTRNESGINNGDLGFYYSTNTNKNRGFVSEAAEVDTYGEADASYMSLAWQHLLMVWDTTEAVLYVDGVEQSSQGGPGATLTGSATQPLLIGSFKKTAPYSWYGTLKEAMLYERRLSPAEIKQLYSDPYQFLIPA